MNPVMRVIFTDFDGVLNSGAWSSESIKGIGLEDKIRDPESEARWILEPARIALLNEAVTRTQAKVVVSSAWRGDGYGIEMLRFAGLLEDAIGETPHGRLDLGLPSTLTVAMRPLEIRAWLQQHPEVESFVAIDDEALRMEHLVRTQGLYGLLQADVDEVVRRLGPV